MFTGTVTSVSFITICLNYCIYNIFGNTQIALLKTISKPKYDDANNNKSTFKADFDSVKENINLFVWWTCFPKNFQLK